MQPIPHPAEFEDRHDAPRIEIALRYSLRLDPCDGRGPIICALLGFSVTGVRLELPATCRCPPGKIQSASCRTTPASPGAGTRPSASISSTSTTAFSRSDFAASPRAASGSREAACAPAPVEAERQLLSLGSLPAVRSVCFGTVAYHSLAALARLAGLASCRRRSISAPSCW